MTAEETLDGLQDRIAHVAGLDPAKHQTDLGVAAAFVRPDVEALLSRLRPGESSIVPFQMQLGTGHLGVQLRIARDVAKPVEGEPEAPPSFHWD